MFPARVLRAWLLSVVVCVVSLAAWVVVAQSISGGMNHIWHNMVDVAIAFGGVFAVIAAVLYIPLFTGLTAAIRRSISRSTATILGAALAPAASLGVALTFRESEDPQGIWTWIQYWRAHGSEFAFSVLPFAAAGASFGLFWSTPKHSQRSQLGGPV